MDVLSSEGTATVSSVLGCGLRRLQLHYNLLSGSLAADSISELSRLVSLNLAYNHFSGK